MTYAERQIVAEILSLPDGPWEPFPGYATTEAYAADMLIAASHNRGCRGRKALAAEVNRTSTTRKK